MTFIYAGGGGGYEGRADRPYARHANESHAGGPVVLIVGICGDVITASVLSVSGASVAGVIVLLVFGAMTVGGAWASFSS